MKKLITLSTRLDQILAVHETVVASVDIISSRSKFFIGTKLMLCVLAIVTFGAFLPAQMNFGFGYAAAQSQSSVITIGHSQKCVDLPDGNRDDMTNLNQYFCDQSPEQLFTLALESPGYFSIKSNVSDKCFDTGFGSEVLQYTCDQSDEQSFSLSHLGSGYYTIKEYVGGLCLGVSGASTADNVSITKAVCDGSQAQMFNFYDTTTGMSVLSSLPLPQPQRPVVQSPQPQPRPQRPVVQQPSRPVIQQPQRPVAQQPSRPGVQQPQRPVATTPKINGLVNTFSWSADSQAIDIGSDGRFLATGGWDNNLTIWDDDMNIKSTTSLSGYGDLLLDLAFSPDSSRVVTGSRATNANWEQTVSIWDAASGQQALLLNGQVGGFCGSVAYDPQGRYVAAGCFNQYSSRRTVQIWNAATGALVRTIDGANGKVAFSPNGMYILAGDWQELGIWDVGSGQKLLTIDGSTVGGFESVLYTTKGYVITGNTVGSVASWDIATGKMLAISAGHTKKVNDIAISSDATRVVTAGEDGLLILWDTDTGNQLASFQTSDPFTSVAFTTDDEAIFSGGGDKVLRYFRDN